MLVIWDSNGAKENTDNRDNGGRIESFFFSFFSREESWSMGRRQSKHTLVCLELKPRPWNCYPGGVYGIISLKLSLKPYWRRDARCMSDKKLLGGGRKRKKEKEKIKERR